MAIASRPRRNRPLVVESLEGRALLSGSIGPHGIEEHYQIQPVVKNLKTTSTAGKINQVDVSLSRADSATEGRGIKPDYSLIKSDDYTYRQYVAGELNITGQTAGLKQGTVSMTTAIVDQNFKEDGIEARTEVTRITTDIVLRGNAGSKGTTTLTFEGNIVAVQEETEKLVFDFDDDSTYIRDEALSQTAIGSFRITVTLKGGAYDLHLRATTSWVDINFREVQGPSVATGSLFASDGWTTILCTGTAPSFSLGGTITTQVGIDDIVSRTDSEYGDSVSTLNRLVKNTVFLTNASGKGNWNLNTSSAHHAANGWATSGKDEGGFSEEFDRTLFTLTTAGNSKGRQEAEVKTPYNGGGKQNTPFSAKPKEKVNMTLGASPPVYTNGTKTLRDYLRNKYKRFQGLAFPS